MKCIICNNEANATGSHVVPASLIQNCIGKHYKEESYEINASKVEIDVFFGRDNLKNTCTDIRKNHYKEDYILCQNCEDNLAIIERDFATEFLGKFRNEKYKQNYEYNIDEKGFELISPKKISNDKILFYFYSIIYRFCMQSGSIEYLENKEIDNIKLFLNGYLYEDKPSSYKYIKDYNLVIIFNKENANGSYILEHSENPYMFYFCEPILLLFTSKLDSEASDLFENSLNNISFDKSKIIVNKNFYETLTEKISNFLAKEFITNAISNLCELNNKSYEENLIEFNQVIQTFDNEDNERSIKAYKQLIEKYNNLN